MNWLFVAVTVGTAILAALAGSRLLNARLRRQVHETGLFLDYLTRSLESRKVGEGADPVAIEWPASFPIWGLDLECGIDVVDSEGKVVGTALVPAPALN
jgi:hypothetical protein